MASNTSLISYKTRVTTAEVFVATIDAGPNNVFYLFAANPFPYAGGDTVVPTPNDSVQCNLTETYRNMIFGKHIQTSDIIIMVPNFAWTANTVYNMYDDADGNLFNEPFFVVVNAASQYDVFKCLYNANGAPSTVQPNLVDTSPADTFYQTSDGYQWKYMYSIPLATYNKFATSEFVPAVPNANVTGNAVPGSLDLILTVFAGSGYTYFTNGQFNGTDVKFGGNPLQYNLSSANASSVNGFYTSCYLVLTGGTGAGQYSLITNYQVIGTSKVVTIANSFTTTPDGTTTYDISPQVLIVGDGNETINAAARAVINGTSVDHIEILTRGKNYFKATANVVVPAVVGNVVPAILRPIMPPSGGHGFDPYEELGGMQVGISVHFSNTENGTVPANNQFRTIGILQSPKFANVILSIESSSGAPGSNGAFIVGQQITQANSGAYGIIAQVNANNLVVTNATGLFVTGNNTYGFITNQANNASAQVVQITNNDAVKNFETFNQLFRINGTLSSGHYTQDEFVNQGNTLGQVHSSFINNSSTTLYLSNTYGKFAVGNLVVGNTSGISMNVTSTFPGDLVVGSGQILYLDNLTPITRTANNTETAVLVLGF